MDARAYFQLADAIAAAETADRLTSLHERVQTTEMHPIERKALNRVLRSRSDALRLGEILVSKQAPTRGD